MPGEGRRYRFGPLERRGLVAGWRGGQIASVATGLVVGVLALRSRPSVLTVLAAAVAVAGGVAVAWWPLAGRTGEEWLPTVSRWAAVAARGRRRLARPWAEGHCVGPDGHPCLAAAVGVGHAPTGGDGGRGHRSGSAAGGNGAAGRSDKGAGRRRAPEGPFGRFTVLSFLPPPSGRRVGGDVADGGEGGRSGTGAGGAMGVVLDRRTRTYTAVLEVRGHNFALLGGVEKERRLGAWSSVLAALAREGSVVHRLQWVATTVPDDGVAVRRYTEQRRAVPPTSAPGRSYAELLDVADAATCRHEVHLAVQVRATGAGARAARAHGGGDLGCCTVLARETAGLRRQLLDADVEVERVLGARALAAVVRRTGEVAPALLQPGQADGGGRGRAGAGQGGRCPPCAVGWPWPVALEEEWGCLRTDGTWHATYWIAEWPRVDVGPDFMGPLLLGSVRRTVAVAMAPISPSRAVREAEQARTADLADEELRRRGGFLSTARRAREAELAGRREEELADGHASFRFSGFVTVTAPTRAALAAGCEATEHAAGQCRMELRRLYGAQLDGFASTLPLALGLA